MTRERAKELLPVIQAWAEGKEIQVSLDGKDWRTLPSPNPMFENENWEWRVKPEPREFWIENSPTCDLGHPWRVWTSLPSTGFHGEVIHVKEVV